MSAESDPRYSDNSLYVGHTEDLEVRLAAHKSRHYSGRTARRLPINLIFCDICTTRDEPFAVERYIKGWSRAKKLALADGDWELIQRLSLRRTPQPVGIVHAPLLVREPHYERWWRCAQPEVHPVTPNH